MGLLHVPAESAEVESMEKGHESAVPVGVMHVDRIDAGFAQGERSAFGALTHLRKATRVDQSGVSESTPRCHDIPLVMAEPQTRFDVGVDFAALGDQAFEGCRILDVDADVQASIAALDEFGDRRYVVG